MRKLLTLAVVLGFVGLGARIAAADLRPGPEDDGTAGPDTAHHDATAKHAGNTDDEDPTLHYNLAGHWFSFYGYDVEGHPKADPDYNPSEAMSPPFVFALVNFAIFLFLLAKYGSPVAKNLAAERHDQIKSALDEARQLRDKAAAKLADYDKRIANLDGEIVKLVDGLKADAAADKARILANAETQAAHMKRDAELRIAAEIEYARAALTREVSVAATRAAEQLLAAKLQPADQEKLVATFIADVQVSRLAGTEAKS